MDSIFIIESCYSCGILFAVERSFQSVLRDTHRTFYCPNGHQQSYTQKNPTEIANSQRDKAQAEANEALHGKLVLERELEKVKAEAQRVKNRIARGVCSCCNRTFRDLASHMKSQHPMQIPGRAQKQIEAAK